MADGLNENKDELLEAKASHETSDDYTFVQEKIKERPVNRRKIVKQSITTVAMAVVFGLVACVTFMLLEPVIGKLLAPKPEAEETHKVILPEDEDEMLPENMVLDDDELNKADSVTTELQPNIGDAYATYEIQMADYQLLYDKMYGVVSETAKSMVTVRHASTDSDWFLNPYETGTETTGIIVADNEIDMFILTYSYVVEGQGDVIVTFCDGVKITASVCAVDSEMGYAIVSIPLETVPEGTKSAIHYASLGNSNAMGIVGDVVMAVGSPMGYNNSVGYGIVTSAGNEINTLDYNYRLLTTDIYGSSLASGVIVNMRGQVVAIIDQSHNSKDLSNLVSGVGISEMKRLIESMSNGESTSHLGLYVTDVSSQAKELGIPKGAYVINVKMDSTAMLSGIRKGDVIVAINDVLISSVKEYESELRELKPEDEVTITVMRENGEGYSELNINTKAY